MAEPTRRVVLVTGAAGFAGRHLVAELAQETDWDIVGLSRRKTDFGRRAKSVACDLLDQPLVDRVVLRFRPNLVFHLAAQSYVPKAIADPGTTLTNNILGQVNLFQSLLKLDQRPSVLIASSGEIYGSPDDASIPLDENAPLKPGNPYAVSKATQDLLGYQYHLSSDLPVVRVRPFNHAGPGQSDRFVMSGFARQVAEAEAGRTEPTILVGNLDAKRDFLDVRDVVRAYRLIIERGAPGDAYNVCSGEPTAISWIVERLLNLASIPLSVKQDPARMRPSDTPVVYGNSSKIATLTGWHPRITLEQTIRDTLDYWRAAFVH